MAPRLAPGPPVTRPTRTRRLTTAIVRPVPTPQCRRAGGDVTGGRGRAGRPRSRRPAVTAPRRLIVAAVFALAAAGAFAVVRTGPGDEPGGSAVLAPGADPDLDARTAAARRCLAVKL